MSYLPKFPLFCLITAAHMVGPPGPATFHHRSEIYIEIRFSSLARNVTCRSSCEISLFRRVNRRFQNRKWKWIFYKISKNKVVEHCFWKQCTKHYPFLIGNMTEYLLAYVLPNNDQWLQGGNCFVLQLYILLIFKSLHLRSKLIDYL